MRSGLALSAESFPELQSEDASSVSWPQTGSRPWVHKKRSGHLRAELGKSEERSDGTNAEKIGLHRSWLEEV